jgi:hypothetical protein
MRDNRNQKIYGTYRWRYKLQPLFLSKNPQCQNITDGKQCAHHSQAVHHLVDPKDDPKLAFDWTNLVAVCFKHHAGGQRGETQEERYAATIGVMDAIYYHKGHVLPTWHKDYSAPKVGNIATLPGTTSSAIDPARIDAALGSDDDIAALLAGV